MTSLVGWLFKYTESPFTPKTYFQLTLFSIWMTSSLSFFRTTSTILYKDYIENHVIRVIIGIP